MQLVVPTVLALVAIANALTQDDACDSALTPDPCMSCNNGMSASAAFCDASQTPSVCNCTPNCATDADCDSAPDATTGAILDDVGNTCSASPSPAVVCVSGMCACGTISSVVNATDATGAEVGLGAATTTAEMVSDPVPTGDLAATESTTSMVIPASAAVSSMATVPTAPVAAVATITVASTAVPIMSQPPGSSASLSLASASIRFQPLPVTFVFLAILFMF